jgi:hypothetical protein
MGAFVVRLGSKMPRSVRNDDSWDEADDDIGNDETGQTVACPYCRREVYEDAEQCPYCGRYISAEDSPPSRKPWWIIIGVVACLYAVYRWVAP